MKNLLVLIALVSFIFSGLTTRSQNVVRQAPCNNITIQQQADSIKANLALAGFIVIKEASVTMESEYEIPVIVPLTQGSWYQFVFIGDNTSKLYEVRMFDWNERQVVYQKKMWGDVGGNIMRYDYIPQVTE